MDVKVEKADSLSKEENGVSHQENGSVDEPKSKDGSSDLQANLPRDAVDEWPVEQVHYFYFVRYRKYEDPKLKAKLVEAEEDIINKSKARSDIYEKITPLKERRSKLITQVKPLHEERRLMQDLLKEKVMEIKPLNHALGQLRGKNGGPREKGAVIYSSEQDLNNHIKSLEYRIQHESIPLPEEKQILREIKQLESTRSKVAANAASRVQMENSMGEKASLQEQVNLIGVDLEGVKKDKVAINAKIKPLDDECEELDNKLKALYDQLKAANELLQAAIANKNELRRQGNQGNDPYVVNSWLLSDAQQLATKKDVAAVKQLENSEVEKFMSSWNSDKAFRDDYEKRILSSLDSRQLSRDGRRRIQGEQPLVPATPAHTSTVATAKANVKQGKENNVQVVDQPQKEDKAVLTKENKKKETATSVPVDLEEEIIAGKKDSKPKKKEVDEVKLKEMKREEELAKAKQALERKKKLAEKAAAKAAIKAQKEAEKKLKEKAKKAKKKAAASGSAPEAEERSADEEAETTEEPEKVEEDVKPLVSSKSKPRKENTAKLRTKPRGGPEALPRAILKRKRSANYWVWGVPAAAVAAGLVVLAVGYTYFI